MEITIAKHCPECGRAVDAGGCASDLCPVPASDAALDAQLRQIRERERTERTRVERLA